jgi:SAM-dependent methyltransferase
MKKKVQDSIINYHNKLYDKFGDSPASLGLPKGRQNLRFSVFSEIGDLNNSKILDVGCGFGHLVSFLESKKIKFDYTGVDINPEFIKIARGKHPGHKFLVKDIEKDKFSEHFDWVFAIGTNAVAGSYDYVNSLLKETLRICEKGVAMDFMSTYVDFRRPGTWHASPERIFKIAKGLSRRVVMRHDYLPFEFCAYIYKNDKLNPERALFVDFPA